MINFADAQPISTIGSGVALAVGAAIVGSQLQYPQRADSYKVMQVSSTFSSFRENLRAADQTNDRMASEIASIYASFADRQISLGAEFEAAIFDDLDGLYES